MKLVCVLAFLVASVAIFGGTAKALPIDDLPGFSYTEEDKKEDASIQQLIEKSVRQISERIRAVVQRTLDILKEKLAESKELVAEFGERFEAIKSRLAEVAKKNAQQALQTLAKLRREVFTLIHDIKKAIAGGEFLYEVALYEDNPYDEEMINNIKKKVAAHIRSVLTRIEASIRDVDVDADKTKIEGDLKTLRESVIEVTGDFFKKAGDFDGVKEFTKIEKIRKDLTDLIEAVRKKVNKSDPVVYAAYDLLDALVTIRDIITEPAGLHKLKAYLNSLQTTHPTVALVRAYVEASSDDALIEILKGFFSGLDGIHLADFPITDLAELFRTVRDEILTDAGIQKLREYAKKIETNHPVVMKVKSAIETRPDSVIREFLGELFSGLDF